MRGTRSGIQPSQIAYNNPFKALMQSNQYQQSMIAKDADRASKEEMEASRLGLSKEQFEEVKRVNLLKDADRTARLGLARSAASRRGKGMTAAQKEIARRNNILWDIEQGYKEDKRLKKKGTQSTKSAITPYQRETLHPDDKRILEARDAAMKSDLGYIDRAAAISADVEDTSFFNPFNWNKNALRSQTF